MLVGFYQHIQGSRIYQAFFNKQGLQRLYLELKISRRFCVVVVVVVGMIVVGHGKFSLSNLLIATQTTGQM